MDRQLTHDERNKHFDLSRYQFDETMKLTKLRMWMELTLRLLGVITLIAACVYFGYVKNETALVVSLLTSIVYLVLGWPGARPTPPRLPE